MSFPAFPAFGPPVMVSPNPEYVAGLKRRRDAIERLCGAAKDYLCADLDEAIERAERGPIFPMQNSFRPEMLVDAIARRDLIQGQLDALHAFVEELPDKQRDFILSIQEPLLESQMSDAEAWITTVQSKLEDQASIPKNQPQDKPE